jgi:DNA uptake protein ComE-like DNA-binding protein
MRLLDKVAIVTGAASGMGAATARLFAREGAKVLVADVLEAEGKAVAESIKSNSGEARFQRLDVASEKEIEALRYIGPALAKRIIADRDSLGPFGSKEGFSRVKGIGPSIVAKLDSAVTFSLLPRPTNRVISRPSELPKARRKPHRRDMRP